MKRGIPHLPIAIVLLASAFGQSANQQNSENSSSEKEVREAIEKYKTALLRRDVAALGKIWADDYVFVNASGDVLTKEQRLANVKSGATALDSINEDENLTVRVYQNSAVTTSRVTIKGRTVVNLSAGNTGAHSFGLKACRLAISSNQPIALPK
jgi:hypothetical protein